MNDLQTLLRQLPSVNQLLTSAAGQDLRGRFGHDLTVFSLRSALDETRGRILENQQTSIPSIDAIIELAGTWLEAQIEPTLFPVINATGVIVHTNLGRAPLSRAARQAIDEIGTSYSTLEYDLASGKRGSRTVHAEQLLRQVTGGEAALVVNNNASAVILMLTALCQGREVIISRGQLVEIGGGFRVPDIMAQSGAKLVEVGTTNRTHLRDYAAAINENTAAILIAHHSNYKIIGFTTEPEHAELARLAHDKGILLLYDQGSGALLDCEPYGLTAEPTVQDGLEDGCDVVAFSGDKLLGGPQAGILCGRAESIQQLRGHPLARAVRADKLCLAGLSATLAHYAKGEATSQIPVWQMISRPLKALENKALAWAADLETAGIAAGVTDGFSTVGGGSLPGTTIPTKLVSIGHDPIDQLAARLRNQRPAVIGRIQDDQLLIDPRTVLPEQEEALLNNIKSACQPS